MKAFRYLIACGFGVVLTASALAADHDLGSLERLALEHGRALQAARDDVEAARHGVVGAAAFPNPEVEYLAGSQQRRGGYAGAVGETRAVALTQPLDLPWRRAPRIAAAEARLDAARAGLDVMEAEVLAVLRTRYYTLLRREAEQWHAENDAQTMGEIHARIARSVEVGESARFELLKADAELLNAKKNAQAAGIRVEQARAQLRQAVGERLPPDFTVNGRLRDVPAPPPLARMQTEWPVRSPDLRLAEAEVRRAERLLELERAARWPQLALKASVEEEPELRSSRLGVVLAIPLWDRRQGPVGEAAAHLSRSRHLLEGRRFTLAQSLEVAYQQYEIAHTHVTALETGIVRQAEAALRVATDAYRFGERGFLEVLDAQRVFRAARAELIQARHELALAWIDIEKLRALPKE